MELHRLLTPFNYSSGTKERIKYIVIHYVGAAGGAKANCEYYAGKYIGASAHYFVGFEGEVWQSVEDKDIAWHCGAKSYRHRDCRNSNSIGIELCVKNRGNQAADSRDWYFTDATVKSAVELTRLLMAKYHVAADHVLRHYDVTGKICPNPYVYNHTAHTWAAFQAALREGGGGLWPDTASPQPGWSRDEREIYRYRREDGSLVVNQWRIIAHHWYLFGENGDMMTGWQRWNGSRVVAWDEAGDWYFLDNTKNGPLEGACWHSRENGSQEIWEVE